MGNLIFRPNFLFVPLFLSLLFLAGCSDPSSSQSSEKVISAGDSQCFSLGTTEFNMQYCPGGTFPTGAGDSGSETISDAFWIGETEVTYELWYAVYTWATEGTGNAAGAGAYTFSNTGIPGDDGTAGTETGSQEPVTTINWRDSMVFCNALTEYFNAHNSGRLTCVYTRDSDYATPIRTSTDSTTVTWDEGAGDNDGTQDDPFLNPDATGFRIPGSYEWECAARYIDGESWTPGKYASGASANTNDLTATAAVAVYEETSGDTIAVVKSRNANALGCYDMSGNVWEWNYEWDSDRTGISRIMRSGGWNYGAVSLGVGQVNHDRPTRKSSSLGLRLCRSAN